MKVLFLVENCYLSGSFPNTSVAHVNTDFGLPDWTIQLLKCVSRLLLFLHFYYFCLFHLGHELWQGLHSHFINVGRREKLGLVEV